MTSRASAIGVLVVLLLPARARAEEDAALNWPTMFATWRQVHESDALFLRGSRSTVSGSDRDRAGTSWSVGAVEWETYTRSYAIYHQDTDGVIGGGDNGLDGILRVRVAAGAILPIAPGPTSTMGPFARVGFGGQWRGNQSFTLVDGELPDLQLGFLRIDKATSFEMGAEGAISWGRWRMGEDATRRWSGNLSWGGFAQAHLLSLLLRAEYRRHELSRDAPVPEEWRVRTCLALPKIGLNDIGDAGPIEGCIDASSAAARTFLVTSTALFDSRAVYTGISIGLGSIRSDPDPRAKASSRGD